ncbi:MULTISPECIES: hypothetical protein [unclassified Sphingomonas]|uniref:hypothetical protein n=1 Tax=unclassified Sphingomonas TaxID=196159 RepID=UPI001AC7EDB8|nr:MULTISPECIES: hypothetical protein [unclassified Sphingomonas]MBN8847687.1 hypothetical protein [Sphingomonas sp.]
MRSIYHLGATGLACLALPVTAAAKAITYDCDTSANHFSELSLPSPSVPFSVSGKVQLLTLAGSETYAPIARIQIASAAVPGRTPSAYAGFSLSAPPADPKKNAFWRGVNPDAELQPQWQGR